MTYCALDEATKAAAVEVVYGRSLYAGAGNASTKLAGEVIGILAGPNPAEVQSGPASFNFEGRLQIRPGAHLHRRRHRGRCSKPQRFRLRVPVCG